jgi:hypothetical protein
MFNRVLIDNEYFLTTAGLLGGITVTLKGRGLKVKANKIENTKFLDICDELKSRGGSVNPESKEFGALIDGFSEALCGRGDARWQAYFLVMTCESIVDDALSE